MIRLLRWLGRGAAQAVVGLCDLGYFMVVGAWRGRVDWDVGLDSHARILRESRRDAESVRPHVRGGGFGEGWR